MGWICWLSIQTKVMLESNNETINPVPRMNREARKQAQVEFFSCQDLLVQSCKFTNLNDYQPNFQMHPRGISK